MIGGCALNHGLKKVHACGKGLCAKVWDIHVQWLCTVCDTDWGHLHPSLEISQDTH